ncbi:GPR endopeptidase [Pseudoflavonifractor sp. BIOML-A6]|uniref:Germination protease n=1 Tax=Lawsonibacter faecis TaxID=2763052 RepID=A0A8J6MGC9_9FIRM|nr:MULTISPECIES: GPR endopeptidase [Oscillospiraceae]MTQ97695.1 GPR endopeptidase [Pseudoflavonifractor sp. BIOML-A16]MTR07399.1 GPR endopeptidase [Pseudoflavonifractor sp. BIOML-A15]MTR33068.1 GPR endopeptidase [Pseudoflavonifractor sp. BIOML-A14]MTR74395.1 GPR endopeptidase [Pseudoflavonifractor sp. BIOML-A18]MTS65518.1 GPR endopeptidase [Pseudoflavonifractor sp. BIOML-A5]MTS72776.1 GPR endopeptidase [Pseudoflavonifractor sp. BIOML-A8]
MGRGVLKRRTDLAMEAKTLWEESAEKETRLEGVEARDTEREGYKVTTVRILNERGAAALEKPVGNYVTLLLDGLARREEDAFGRAARALGGELRALLKLPDGASALVVGLGNRAITPDAVGPKAAEHTMVTRHLVERVPEHFGSFRPVAALAAGVLGTTGMESGELVQAVVAKLKPDCVLAVDALASRSLDRVCRTIQIADTGIVPGSGVGNARAALNRETLGVPVIAIGVPTVVDAATLCADVLAEAGRDDLDPDALRRAGSGVIVTPKEIDSHVADISKVIGFGVNLALQTGLTVQDVEMFLS